MKTAEQWYLSETMLFALKWTPERVMETVSAIQTDARVDLERELASVTKELQSLKDTHGTLLTALEYNRNERDSLQSALRTCTEALLETKAYNMNGLHKRKEALALARSLGYGKQ